MCIICLHFQNDILTPAEAMSNLDEMSEVIGSEHTREVVELIIESEINRIEQEFQSQVEESQIKPIDFQGKELKYL